jgi:hypothetical protein
MNKLFIEANNFSDSYHNSINVIVKKLGQWHHLTSSYQMNMLSFYSQKDIETIARLLTDIERHIKQQNSKRNKDNKIDFNRDSFIEKMIMDAQPIFSKSKFHNLYYKVFINKALDSKLNFDSNNITDILHFEAFLSQPSCEYFLSSDNGLINAVKQTYDFDVLNDSIVKKKRPI